MKYSILYLFSSLFPFLGVAQKIQGTWEGLLFQKLKISFHVIENKGIFKATWDDPDEGVMNALCTNVEVKEDSIFIDMKSDGFRYEGKLDSSGENIQGYWISSAYSYGKVSFDIKRTSKESHFIERVYPQEPKPPFPYTIEELEYYNKDSSIKFGATLTYPKADSISSLKRHLSYPAVLLITGSGQQNRDENLSGPKPFELIADQLTRMGVAVLRVDDRGIGKSTGDFSKSTTLDFVEDVKTSMEFLKKRPEIDPGRLGLIGHSEGGLIASIVASERNDVSFIALLAAPGLKMLDVASQQVVDIAIANGYDSLKMIKYKSLFRSLLNISLHLDDSVRALEKSYAAYSHWQKKAGPVIEAYIFGKVKDSAGIKSYCSKFYSTYHNADPGIFAKLNMAVYLSKVKCPVLALNGSKDIVVSSHQNLGAIERTLKKNEHVKNFKVLEIAGLNHYFQHCNKCNFKELGELNETFAPEALQVLLDWVIQNVQ